MFGDIVQQLRKSNSLTQVELARKLGVSKQAVSNWENNNILPSVDMLVQVAKFFNVSCDYLLEINKRTYIEVSGLTLEQISHIQQIINDIRE